MGNFNLTNPRIIGFWIFCFLCVNCININTALAEKHRWNFLVAHNPTNYENNDLIKKFIKTISEKSNADLEIKIQTLADTFTNPHPIAIGNVFRGEVEMSQVAIDRLYKYCPEMDALDAPLVFRNHEHAEKVLDGAIGDQLKKCLLTGSNGRLHGLYFTYSGGYRNIYSLKPLNSLRDLRGMRMGERGGRLGNDLMDYLGVEFTFYPPFLKDFMQQHEKKEIDAEEAEINRMVAFGKAYPEQMSNAKYMLETNHSLYLTLLVVNGSAYNALSKKNKLMLEQEAKKLAKSERLLSIKQEMNNKKDLMSRGVIFQKISEEDLQTLQRLSKRVYRKYQKSLGSLIQSIKQVK